MILVLGAASGACQAVGALREALHAEAPPPHGEAPIPPDRAGLRVEVTPPEGLSLLLDGRPVAQAAPWERRDLKPGPHTLEVRAMGYLPVVLTVELVRGQATVLPVALRQRGELPPAVPAPQVPPEPPPTPATPPPPEHLPPEIAPIALRATGRPPGRVWVDGVGTEAGGTASLGLRRGSLQVGLLAVGYRIGADRSLTLVLPDDSSSWQVDGAAAHGGSEVGVAAAPLQVRRRGLDGDDQTLILRRLD